MKWLFSSSSGGGCGVVASMQRHVVVASMYLSTVSLKPSNPTHSCLRSLVGCCEVSNGLNG